MAPRTSLVIARRARAFRRALPEPEAMLWSRLKGRGQDKPIFRRQFAFQTVILDFYCPAAKLAVEIDGATHWTDEKREKDFARDRWLDGHGIEVVRIGAGEVYARPGDVADHLIRRALERIGGRWRCRWLSLSTTPSAGRGPPLPSTTGKETKVPLCGSA